MPTKKRTVIVSSVGIWLALIVSSGWPWTWIWRLGRGTLAAPALLSASLWACVLLWATHHLTFQVGGLFRTSMPPAEPPNDERPAVAILYATCDDFNGACCESCLDQDYENLRVLVLDDSRSPRYKRMVEEFCAANARRCERVTRPSDEGFKAGNLNYALQRIVQEDWALLVDADQTLPPNYLSTLVARLPQDKGVAFLQTANRGSTDRWSSPFQAAHALTIPLYFFRDLSLREGFGFLPLLGHSAMIRKSVWQEVGGFPLVVSEDYAFALRLAARGQRGVFLREPVALERTPYDFGAFILRLRKYAGGTAQLFRQEAVPFLLGRANLAEKWDALMQLSWYFLMPLVTLNGFLSGYVLHTMRQQGPMPLR